ncbi:MAG TPA: BadF/BadG/BcrA/BcrD ATPase family protein [Gemmataceae bacterium]|nr:BadF/BadG/BcrA/BcrD ATPase family protein [Gemmataceae bacterium]
MAQYPDLILGIDGGGSHTIAVLAERASNGRILGRGEAGPSNIQSVGDAALRALEEAIAGTFANTGRARGSVAAAVLGLAGVDHPDAVKVIRAWAERFGLADRLKVENDSVLLLAAGTPQGWGLAVVAGTGSIAFARNRDGRMERSGGWGYVLGDEGSAYSLGLGGLRAVARASDGSAPATILTRTLLARMNLREPLEMIEAVYRGDWDRARIATLAPLVGEAAESGDAVAAGIVALQARLLAETVVAAARKVELPRDRVPLALTGGPILNGQHYREHFLSALRKLDLNPDPVALVHDPVEGAIRIARELA